MTSNLEIQNIAMVGAYSAVMDGGNDDDLYFTQIMRYLMASGVPMADKISTDVIDLNFGADFLTMDKKYDLVIACYVPNPPEKIRKQLAAMLPQMDPQTAAYLRTSPHHSRENWQRRIRESGAKIVATVGTDSDEIDPGYLQSASHKAIIHCGDYRSPGYRPQGDCPMTTGFMASIDYLRNLPQGISGRTTLGQGLIAAARELKAGNTPDRTP